MLPRATHDERPVLVIGAGVVGASAAYHLARAGRQVTVIEHRRSASGVTRHSFAWVGTAKNEAAAFSLELRSVAAQEFARLENEIGAPMGLRRHGAITWESSDEKTREFVASHAALGHDVRLIDRPEVLLREPHLLDAPAVAAFAPDDAGVDPVSLTRALLRGAVTHGAVIREGVRATSIIAERHRAVGVQTEAGPIFGSAVVLAAGTATPALATSAGCGIEVDASPSCLIRFRTPEPLVRGILSTPDFEVRQLDDATLIAAEDVPEGFDGDALALAGPTLSAIHRLLNGGRQVTLLDAVVADRPVPRAGQPQLGFARDVSGLYLAAVHPAIILAGAIGAQIARDFAE